MDDGGDDDGPGSLQSDSDLESFFNILLIFVGTGILAAVFLICILRKSSNFTSKDGFFVSTSWPLFLRGPLTMGVMLIVVLPSVITALGMVFGCLMAAGEGWSMFLGTAYVLGNLLGLQEPLTNISPDSAAGKMLDIIISLYALISATTVMGMASSMCLIQSVSTSLPRSFCGFLRLLVLYLPMAIMIICIVFGGFFAVIERWPFLNGFYYVTGGMAELANPLVSGPTTPEGSFVEVVCVCIQLCMCGAVIGTVSWHPQVIRFIRWFEGDATEEFERLKQRAAELESTISKCTNSEWKMRMSVASERSAMSQQKAATSLTGCPPGCTAEHISQAAAAAPVATPSTLCCV